MQTIKNVKSLIIKILVLILLINCALLIFFIVENKNSKTNRANAAIEWSSGGTGTESDPYKIKSESDLRNMEQVFCDERDINKIHFALMRDLELYNFYPIFLAYYDYISCYPRGVFDGNNHTITINNDYNQDNDYNYIKERGGIPWGLFENAGNLTIKNLKLEGSLNMEGHKLPGFIGGLVGRVELVLDDNLDWVSSELNIINCYVNLDIYVNDTDTYDGDDPYSHVIGGFVGFLAWDDYTDEHSSVNIENSCFLGSISIKGNLKKGDGSYLVNAYCGYSYKEKWISVKNSYYAYTKTINQRGNEIITFEESDYINDLESISNNFHQSKISNIIWYQPSKKSGKKVYPMQVQFVPYIHAVITTGEGGKVTSWNNSVYCSGGMQTAEFNSSTGIFTVTDNDNTSTQVSITMLKNYEYVTYSETDSEETVEDTGEIINRKIINFEFKRIIKIIIENPLFGTLTTNFAVLSGVTEFSEIEQGMEIKTYYDYATNSYFIEVNKIGVAQVVCNSKYTLFGWQYNEDTNAVIGINSTEKVDLTLVNSDNEIKIYPILAKKQYYVDVS